MEIFGHDVEHVIAMVAMVVVAITPVARALMALSHVLRRLASLTQNETDDAIAASFVYAMESFCGTMAKLMLALPRVTMGGK